MITRRLPMKDHYQGMTVRPYELTDNLVARKPWRRRLASWLHELSERRHALHLERIRQDVYVRRAAYVRKIIAERGLVQFDYSIAGGRSTHIPQVVAMTDGPPATVDIRLLPGQTPDEFVRQAPAIAYNLDVTEVTVVRIGHLLIRLVLEK